MITALVFVLNNATIIIERSKAEQTLLQVKKTMNLIDSVIRQVSTEGNGSSRSLLISIPDGEIEINSKEDSVIYSFRGARVQEHLSRKKEGNLYIVSGNDVKCFSNDSSLIMENSFIRATFKKVGSLNEKVPINTSQIITSLKLKEGETLNFLDSSMKVDNISTTITGYGYSSILDEGEELPYCVVEVFVNSTKTYKVRFILFAGADFIVERFVGDVSMVTQRLDFYNNPGFSIHKYKDYIAYSNNTETFSTIFAGSYLRELKNTSYVKNGINVTSIILTQDYENNKIFITYSKATLYSLANKVHEIRSDKYISTRFGSFQIQAPTQTTTYMIAFYDNLDITNGIRFGSGDHEILVKNEGRKKISVEVT